MSDEKTIVEYLAGGAIAILSGIGIWHNKKINEMPEKYMSKKEFNEAKKEIREDIQGLHIRFDKLFDKLFEPK